MSGPARILIVEDCDESRAVVKEVLESSGFIVSEAVNGAAALELLTFALPPELVILDLEMPVMSGVELLRAMKKDERLARLPVLILSGSMKTTALRDPAVVGFISKPMRLDELLATVRAHLTRTAASEASSTLESSQADRVLDQVGD